jgi:hypothetical protein
MRQCANNPGDRREAFAVIRRRNSARVITSGGEAGTGKPQTETAVTGHGGKRIGPLRSFRRYRACLRCDKWMR